MAKESIDYRLSIQDTNALKGVAICAMLLHHLFCQNPEYGIVPFKVGLIGKFCVAVFVFLSGYGIAIQFAKLEQKKNIIDKIAQGFRFILRRYVKFYLGYWVVFLIFVPLGVFVFNRPLEAAYGVDANIMKSLCLDMMGLMDYESYNITWWFNGLIVCLYLLSPILCCLMKSNVIGILLLVFFFYWPNAVLFPLQEIHVDLSAYLKIFVLGMLIANNINGINLFLNKLNPIIVLFSSLCVFVVCCLCRNVFVVNPYFFSNKVDAFICLSLALFVVSTSRRMLPKERILSFLGKHSMNIYLTHTFILGYFFAGFIRWFENPILMFFVLLLCSLMTSIAVEFLKRKIRLYELRQFVLDKIDNK